MAEDEPLDREDGNEQRDHDAFRTTLRRMDELVPATFGPLDKLERRDVPADVLEEVEAIVSDARRGGLLVASLRLTDLDTSVFEVTGGIARAAHALVVRQDRQPHPGLEAVIGPLRQAVGELVAIDERWQEEG